MGLVNRIGKIFAHRVRIKIDVIRKRIKSEFLLGIMIMNFHIKFTERPFYDMKGKNNMKVYGYARISRKQQSIERQIRNIKEAYPEAVITQESFTGTKLEGRKEFDKILRVVKSGDTIVFDSVSRMSRNAYEGFTLYQALLQKGIDLVFLKEPHINTSVYREAAEKQIEIVNTGDDATDELMAAITNGINRYMLRLAERQIQLAFAQSQKEVDDLHQRTKEGIETARLQGKQIGGVPGRKLHVKKADIAMKMIQKYSRDFEGTLLDNECIKLTGIARNTYYKYKLALRKRQ